MLVLNTSIYERNSTKYIAYSDCKLTKSEHNILLMINALEIPTFTGK